MSWRPIEGTHLGWTRCATCVADVLSVPEYAGRARCGTCAAPELGPVRFEIGPVIGYSIGRGPRRAESAPVAAAVAPPLVPARYTQHVGEVAKQALKLGFLATDLGWTVDPWYWQASDGEEMSVLVMQRGPLRAVAYWSRKPGEDGWRTAGARAWRDGSLPRAINVTSLVESIEQMGDAGHDDSETAR